eukprot:353667-Chlamydomonas_euryale.AAC.1
MRRMRGGEMRRMGGGWEMRREEDGGGEHDEAFGMTCATDEQHPRCHDPHPLSVQPCQHPCCHTLSQFSPADTHAALPSVCYPPLPAHPHMLCTDARVGVAWVAEAVARASTPRSWTPTSSATPTRTWRRCTQMVSWLLGETKGGTPGWLADFERGGSRQLACSSIQPGHAQTLGWWVQGHSGGWLVCASRACSWGGGW